MSTRKHTYKPLSIEKEHNGMVSGANILLLKKYLVFKWLIALVLILRNVFKFHFRTRYFIVDGWRVSFKLLYFFEKHSCLCYKVADVLFTWYSFEGRALL